VSRSSKGLPFKLRKNFDKFEENPDYGYVMRLGLFFSRFPHIKVESFFAAPYEVYPDGKEDYFNLKFYISPKAIRMYSIYQTQRENDPADSDSQIQFIIQSLKFILHYCRTNNIPIHEYLDRKDSGDLYVFIEHLRQRQTSIYTLFAFENFERRLNEYSNSRLKFTLGENFMNELASRKIVYYNSNRAKCIAEQGLDKIKNLLHN
jgi:hypothetical protein